MKLKSALPALCLCIMYSGIAMSQYCVPVAGALAPCGASPITARINSVATTGAATNISNANNSCAGYVYYTGAGNRIIAQAGTQIIINIQTEQPAATNPTQYPYRIVVWVDWNQDGVFDNNTYNPIAMTGERMIVSPNSGYTYGNYTATLPIPLNAEDGTTRMRIRAGTRNSTAAPYVPPNIATGIDPCAASDFAFGEVEDYDFYVVNPCTEPQNVKYQNLTANSATIKWNKRHNARIYEYQITNTPVIPDPGTGNYLTSDTVVNLPHAGIPVQCGKRHYVYVRSVCDTTGPQIGWRYSPWKMDYFDAPPCCHSPVGVLTDVKSTTATASWMFVPSYVQYEYAVRTDTNTPSSGNVINTNRIALQGLAPGTQLYFFVRAHCSPTPLSAWTMTPFLTQPPTGIEPIAQHNELIQVYPNPVKDRLTISINKPVSDKNRIQITDMAGKLLKEYVANAPNITIDISTLQSGVYLLKYCDGQNHTVLKWVKE
ncbi:hypothetical protein CAP35_12720 [Chitinophagaceae bacterium IBVUCB1]|nr:hypothetical protein CAP35_12720 [Chitinophagaceae bacterium IBVUCB1]